MTKPRRIPFLLGFFHDQERLPVTLLDGRASIVMAWAMAVYR